MAGYSYDRPRKSITLTVLLGALLIYSILPLVWMLFSVTKTQPELLSSFGLWFSGPFSFFDNVQAVVTRDDGVFLKWFANTLVYVVVGAGGATVLATAAGYGLAKYRFRGRNAVFAVILGAIAVPGTALAVPTFLLFSQWGLTNTMWAVILPSLVSPFGLYLMWVFSAEAVPTEILEAARVDGSGEWRTFFTISLRLLAPGIVTVALFAIVATWNNYFLPLIMLNDPNLYPLVLGLYQWLADASGIGAQPVFNLVITGSFLTILPIVVVFLVLQRYWQSGLNAGSVKA
ncbi:carbohydrate ABC transporter permease [Promicromonospora sukumoe]|uniref:Multiple sugar transport system permease protein n=1 Tax=Promicromonospora sukumoe TaxID=88382 RepID=A0A7W3JED5_9MICO|nr:carbohydrate ABC transporter permease [Promicromonospora sukumoe]MBA8811292.1 multiple sugar transport system permease protein [Promicromonospora sukumoe]